MKKYLLILFCLISTFGYSQELWFRTTKFAFANVVNGNYRWDDWENSNIKICINIDTDQIIIYSPEIQVYQVCDVYNNGNYCRDPYGGTYLMYYVIDQDYTRGCIRLRIEENGNSQLYVDFKNVAWVYNVVRIQ